MRKLFTLALAMLLSVAGKAQLSGRLSSLYTASTLDGVLVGVGQFSPVPTALSYWQALLPQTMRNSYITNARGVTNPDWSQIPDSLFAEYLKNGNRSHYESQSFTRRNNLARLVMGEIMERQGNFIPQILNGLDYLINEVWWGVPAHYTSVGDKPERSRQVVDLFNAETANLVSWTVYMLGDELDAARPGIVSTLKSEVQRRLLIPAINNNYSWMSTTSNWNVWISENWIASTMICETDRTRMLNGIAKILRNLDSFANKYPQDGGCDEGVTYWDRAAGSYFECCNLLALASNNAIDMRNDQLLAKLGQYIYNMHISGSYYVNYADAAPTLTPNVGMVFPYGHFIGDTILTQMGALLASQNSFSTAPSRLFNGSGNWPSVSRELTFLNLYNSFKDEKTNEPLVSDSWYPNIQVVTARTKAGSDEGLFLSAKGGNNDELHNHNDVGNMLVYYNGYPMIIDLGSATYTAQTFSNQRYELLNTRSLYHNVPYVNGYEQKDGASYKATNVSYRKNGNTVVFRQDIGRAYPSAAGVGSWIRTLTFDRSNIRVNENYTLRTYTQAPEINFMLAQRALTGTAGRVTLRSAGGSCYLKYDTAQVSVSQQQVSLSGVGTSRTWGNSVYKLTLKPKSTATSAQVEYTITPVEAIDVRPVPQAVTLDSHSFSLDYDNLNKQLNASFIPFDASSVLSWTSSNTDVAVVGSDGVVTGLNSGDCTITCTTAEGRSDTCHVRVAQGIASIDVIGDTYVDGGDPATNFGLASTMNVKKGSATEDQAVYLLFPLKGSLPSGISASSNLQARLVLYLYEVGTGIDGISWDVYPLSGIRWSETALTYNTAKTVRPTLTNLLASVPMRVASDTLLNNRVEFDVTAYTKSRLSSTRVAYYVTQNINSGSGDNNSAFYTKDYADPTVKPRLVFHLNDLVDAIHSAKADAQPAVVNVYTIDGVLLRSGVDAARATEGLPKGLYVVGKRKVIVR